MKSIRVPLHLETEDTFLFGLTLRQCLLLGIGAGMGYLVFLRVFELAPNPQVALILGLISALIFFGGIVALAFVRRGGRGLEEWGLVLLVYVSQPKVYLWHFSMSDECERINFARRASPIRKERESEEAWS